MEGRDSKPSCATCCANNHPTPPLSPEGKYWVSWTRFVIPTSVFPGVPALFMLSNFVYVDKAG